MGFLDEAVARRLGDISECWADVSKAERELCRTAKRDLVDMYRDAWRLRRIMKGKTTQKSGLTLATKHNNRNYINANI